MQQAAEDLCKGIDAPLVARLRILQGPYGADKVYIQHAAVQPAVGVVVLFVGDQLEARHVPPAVLALQVGVALSRQHCWLPTFTYQQDACLIIPALMSCGHLSVSFSCHIPTCQRTILR